jgi:hypothetical protein
LKADVMMKNPAPQNVAPADVLKQLGNFQINCLNLHVLPSVSADNGVKLCAAG